MRPIAKRIAGGIALIGLGTAGTVWMWRLADAEGRYYYNLTLLAPVAGVLGLAYLLLPPLRDARTAGREDVAEVARTRLVNRLWWVALGTAVAAGCINGILIEITHGGSPWGPLFGILLAAVVLYRMSRGAADPSGNNGSDPGDVGRQQ